MKHSPCYNYTMLQSSSINKDNLYDIVLIKEDNPIYHELMCIIFSIGSLGAGLKDVPL